MDHRHDVIVDAEVTLATCIAEREAALAIVQRCLPVDGATLGADKAHDTQDFLADPKARRVPSRTSP